MPILTENLEFDDVTEDPKYARDVSLPFRFTEDADIWLDEDQEVLDQALNLIAFTPQGTIPLAYELGTFLLFSVFDPLDPPTRLAIDTSLRKAFERLEPRVVLNDQFIFDETPDENKLIVIVPYHVAATGLRTVARFVISRPMGG